MVTMRGLSGHKPIAGLLLMLLAGCAARPVLHEFPPALSPAERPPAAVSYELREDEERDRTWVMRGERGDAIGTFRWHVADGRDARFQDGINGSDYLFRIGADEDVRGWESAPPRVTIFDAATGEPVGVLELRTGFDRRFEGMWREGAVFWRSELLPEGRVERETDDGKVEDIYPASHVTVWAGGSNAGLTVFSGRAVAAGQFAAPIHDIAAGRPLTRRELGDAVVMLFAMRALDEAVAVASDK